MRNNALDAAKLLACFFVISLHVAGYPELPSMVVSSINALSRWAVPFFFIASGYYLANKDVLGVISKVKKTSIIILFSCSMYCAFIFIKNKMSFGAMVHEGLSIRFFLSGSYAHLWFLFSLVYGCLIMLFFIDSIAGRKVFIISSTIILLCWISDVANSSHERIDVFYVLREVMSFPLMCLGIFIARKKHSISQKTSMIIILISSLMILIEVHAFNYFFGLDSYERQIPLFCISLSYGVFMLCLSMDTKNNWFSSIGRDYSLGIYIIHLIWIYFFYYTLPSSYQTPSTIVIPLVLIASVLSLMFMKRYMNRAFRLMNGM